MRWFIDLFIILLLVGLFLGLIKRIRRRELQALFRRYNDTGDAGVITTWIEEKQSATRMTDVLDYLLKIEEHQLAIVVFSSFSPDRFKDRHTRLFASRAYTAQGQEEQALELIEGLLQDYPGDDSILEIAIGTYLDLNRTEQARDLLLLRLNRKSRGTAFNRQFARLTAADGNVQEAIDIMEKIVSKDYALYKNTFAPAARRQIYDQYVESQKLLDALTADREKTEQ